MDFEILLIHVNELVEVSLAGLGRGHQEIDACQVYAHHLITILIGRTKL